ncbi:sortase domain-bontaining protein [Streptomyces sp. NPDC088725]|uniref:sortase n=1 Tax=Streptomyces sp. NPDC088725 TaxID=3365873 RepID=UPI0038230E3E
MTVTVQTPPPAAAGAVTPETAAQPDPSPASGGTPGSPAARPSAAEPRLPAGRQIGRGALLALAVLLLGLVANLVLISGLQHRAAQQTAFDALRASLAEGTAPVGQTDQQGRLLAPGTPVALLRIPALHLREVVREGTSSDVLSGGPGHRRDTPLPGQTGTSVLMGRAAAYGGPFGGLADLKPGTTFSVTTGQGRHTYKVLGSRRAGDPSPPPPAPAGGRLVLVTAAGTSYLPGGVLRVDADLVSRTADTPDAVIRPGSLAEDEQPMASAGGAMWELVLWLQLLLAVAVAAVWAWHRWGRQQTWIVFLPVTAAVGLQVADQVTRLLPNLL